jgi:hypothetical protein
MDTSELMLLVCFCGWGQNRLRSQASLTQMAPFAASVSVEQHDVPDGDAITHE